MNLSDSTVLCVCRLLSTMQSKCKKHRDQMIVLGQIGSFICLFEITTGTSCHWTNFTHVVWFVTFTRHFDIFRINFGPNLKMTSFSRAFADWESQSG